MERIEYIIQECQKGNRKAQEQLYDKLAGKIMAVCLRYCGNQQDAKDCFQETCIKIFNSLPTYSHQQKFFSWAKTIAIHTCLDFIKKRNQTLSLDDKAIHLSDDEQENNWDRYPIEKVFSAIQLMPNTYRLIFNMYHLDQYSHQEIANELKISVGTSKSNLHKARKWLKNYLENPSNTNYRYGS